MEKPGGPLQPKYQQDVIACHAESTGLPSHGIGPGESRGDSAAAAASGREGGGGVGDGGVDDEVEH